MLLMMRSKSGHGHGHGHGHVVVVLFLFMFLQLSFATDTYLGLWEHRHCNMSTCELDSVTNTSCTNGTVLSEYCEPGYSACCQSGSSCSHGYGGCVDLQSSGCHSGPAVLGVCEDWEGGAPFDVFCCDEDFRVERFYDKQDNIEGVIFAFMIFLTAVGVLLYCFAGCCEEKNDGCVEALLNFVLFLWVLVYLATLICLLIMIIVVHLEYGVSASVIICYTLFAFYLTASCVAANVPECAIILIICFFLCPMLVLYFDVKSQSVTSYDLYETPVLPTDIPSSFPTVSAIPTAQPSTSFSPTASCPLGSDQTESCEPCPKGQYGDATGCHHCDAWRWTLHAGSERCDYYTAKEDLSDSYAITLCVVYCVLSLICFAYHVNVSGRWLSIVRVMLITGDQVTDILYAQYSVFSNRSLLIFSVCFCLFNLIAQGVWITANMNIRHSRMVEYNKKFSKYLEENGWGSWILHANCKLTFSGMWRSFCFGVIMSPLDILWIICRILIILFIAIIGVICQVLLVITGMILSTTKLMSTPQVFAAFWAVSNPEFLLNNRQVVQSDIIYNGLVVAELFLENIPQITIQITNNYYQSSWDSLAILSLSFSGVMIFSVANHFRHHMYEKELAFKDVPKYDFLREMIAAAGGSGDEVPVPTEDDIECTGNNLSGNRK